MPAEPSRAAGDAGPIPGRPFPWQFTTPLFIGSALIGLGAAGIAIAFPPLPRRTLQPA